MRARFVTNSALVQALNVNTLNELTTITTNSGTLTVAG